MKWILSLIFVLQTGYAESPSQSDAIKVLSNRAIARKIESLGNFAFHSIETDQFIYELKVVNLDHNAKPDFFCMYIVPLDRFIDTIAEGIAPLFFNDFEPCE